MAEIILRVSGSADFPLASGVLEFTDDEVDEVTLLPEVAQKLTFSQEQDLTIYDQGPVHWVIGVVFIVDTWETLLKLDELRNHRAPLMLAPSCRDDPTRTFEVLWTNQNDFIERQRRGWLQLGYAFTASFREPLGAICRPPEVTS